MAEQPYQSLSFNTSLSIEKNNQTSPLGHSSNSDIALGTSRANRQRKRSSASPNNSSSSQSTEATKQRSKMRAMPTRSRGESSRATAMPGPLDPASEITYTPTTHRISKAKKGKKVHACEHPGCTKIFTRAEHRKRHEANHNTSPAFQCEVEGCRKPFQRADLLARHMERQHNMPSAEASAFRSQYRRSSVSEASSPSRSSFSAPHLPQQAPVPAASLPQPAGAMSIGSIIEPNMHRSSYDSHTGGHSLHDISHAPIGTAPRGLAPEFFYGMSSSGDSPLYSSSDSSHSPLSEYLQPQAVSHPYYPQEVTPRPQPVSFETCFQPIIQQSPISAEGGIPTWTGYDPSGVGFVPEAECMTTQRQYPYHSPSWPGTHPLPPYEVSLHSQPWQQWTKIDF